MEAQWPAWHVTVDLLSDTCSNVAIGPTLSEQHLKKRTSTTNDEARVDVSARRFGVEASVYLSISVFAQTHRGITRSPCSSLYHNQTTRIRGKDQWAKQFPTLVTSSTGCMGPEAIIFYKCLAGVLAAQMVRYPISFAKLRPTILCVQGTRSSHYQSLHMDMLDVIVSEACLTC